MCIRDSYKTYLVALDKFWTKKLTVWKSLGDNFCKVCNSSYKVSVNQKGHCSNGEAHTPKYDWSKNPDVLKCEIQFSTYHICLLYTSDAADDTPCVDLGGRRIIKKKKIRKLL
eukprot:TRINITY_DN12247_c0_g1_i4.p1 TRINITY_DN12247_c0_g1~~TRINITY_DN12247_c0_g1_i4.p1  ORF type:complete len:113 (+),score=15.99 TRINITY_DN12247_c0_g1_i4:156-494(+)